MKGKLKSTNQDVSLQKCGNLKVVPRMLTAMGDT